MGKNNRLALLGGNPIRNRPAYKYNTIGEEEKKAVEEVLNSGQLAQGPKVKELEEKFSKFCGTKYAIAVNSGTAAIHAALKSIGIKEGDEVIAPPFTFVATVNPILMQGGKIIFVDVDEETFNIDVKKIEEKITLRTKAIIAVNLYGLPANYTKLKEIADKTINKVTMRIRTPPFIFIIACFSLNSYCI